MVRYQHIIRLSIHGHSHLENVQVARSFSDSTDSNFHSKAIGVHYTSGSVSSFEQIHPTFRLFDIDAETLLPVKIHTYKLTDEGDWILDHTWPESLDIKDLSPKSFEKLAKTILKGDAELAMKF